jgi:hypothetical protein
MYFPFKYEHKGSLLTVTSSGEFKSTPEDKFKDLIATTFVLVNDCSCANGWPSVVEVVTVVARGSSLTTGAVIAMLYRSKTFTMSPDYLISEQNKPSKITAMLFNNVVLYERLHSGIWVRHSDIPYMVKCHSKPVNCVIIN